MLKQAAGFHRPPDSRTAIFTPAPGSPAPCTVVGPRRRQRLRDRRVVENLLLAVEADERDPLVAAELREGAVSGTRDAYERPRDPRAFPATVGIDLVRLEAPRGATLAARLRTCRSTTAASSPKLGEAPAVELAVVELALVEVVGSSSMA